MNGPHEPQDGQAVTVAHADSDPYLAATLWLIDRPCGLLLPGPAARDSRSVHAVNLLTNVIALDGALPGPLLGQEGLGVVLAEPTAQQLEALDRRRFRPGTAWFLIPSAVGTAERDFQDAWAWAQSRPAPSPTPVRPGTMQAAADPTGLLSTAELWALSLRAGMDPGWVTALRTKPRLRLVPRESSGA